MIIRSVGARVALLVSAWSVVSACSDAVAPELLIDTDASSYTITSPTAGPFVGTVIRNQSSHIRLLAACGTSVTPVREQFVNGKWAYKPLVICRRFEPVALMPGEAGMFSFYNYFGTTGTFRYRAPLYRDSVSFRMSGEVSRTIRVREP